MCSKPRKYVALGAQKIHHPRVITSSQAAELASHRPMAGNGPWPSGQTVARDWQVTGLYLAIGHWPSAIGQAAPPPPVALQTDPAAGVNSLSKGEDSQPTNHGRVDEKEAMVAPNKDVIKTEELLGHGRFQFHILVCAQLSAGVLIFHHLSIYLLAPQVDHWCRPPGDQASLTPDQWKNMSIPFYEDGTYSKCTMYDPLELMRNNSTEVPCTQWDFDLRPGVGTIVSEWNLVCGKKWIIRVVLVYSMLGGLIFLPLQESEDTPEE
ncbi:hypothetical protein HPB47_010086 [Ixodes persulcatus]|uniref:Uncharacterized protein n=1 Tax=Ixodes persulcatus TaxID=34615 RepID=A0AC60P0A3_IXOPE|nr:hypothetical protein HPB47_010086 [Ixodes persulcatus]